MSGQRTSTGGATLAEVLDLIAVRTRFRMVSERCGRTAVTAARHFQCPGGGGISGVRRRVALRARIRPQHWPRNRSPATSCRTASVRLGAYLLRSPDSVDLDHLRADRVT